MRVALNGTGAVMTAVAVVVFLGTKFLAGAWVVVIAIPALMMLFNVTEHYYAGGRQGAEARQDASAPAQAREHRDRPDLDREPADPEGGQRRAVARRHGGGGGGGGG